MSQTKCITNVPSPELVKVEEQEVEEKYVLPIVWSDTEEPFNKVIQPTHYSLNKDVANSSTNSSIYAGSLSIPANNNWEGEHGFRLVFIPQHSNITKSSAWTYSPILRKLYTMMNTPFPLNIQVSRAPPDGSIVRVMAVYSLQHHAGEVVTRCIIHAQPDDTSNYGHPAPDHLVRCDNPNATYKTDPETGRQFVTVPYKAPEEGITFTTYLFRIMCLGSCSGGINRRPLFLIFSLMYNHQCIGRYTLPVRSCACPGRDRLLEEKRFTASINDQEKDYSSTQKRNTGCESSQGRTKRPRVDSSESDSDEEKEYILKVKGRTSYEILSKLNDALQLVKLLTPSQIKTYKDLQRRSSKTTT